VVAGETLQDDKLVQLNDFLEHDTVAGQGNRAPIQTRSGRCIHISFGWRDLRASLIHAQKMKKK
jgi:hypothetical protein